MAFTCQAQHLAELSSATPQNRFTRSCFPVQPVELTRSQSNRCRNTFVSKHIQAPFRSSTHRSHGLADRGRSCRANATGGGDGPQDSPQIAMSPQEAYDLLGVKEGASFEQIMTAKNRLVSKAGNDQGLKTQLEVAYDTLLMQAMQRRIKGEVAGQSVRFADVPKRRPASQVARQAIQKLPGGLVVSTLSKDDSLKQGGAFAGLAAWALLQALTDPPGVAQSDVPSLQLAIAVIVSLYVFRDKKRIGLARAGGITAAGLITGALVGSALQSWLRVDIVPIGNFSSPGIFVGEFALGGLWAAVTFLA